MSWDRDRSEAEDLSELHHSRVFAYEAGQIIGKVLRPTPDRTIDVAAVNVKSCFYAELLVDIHERTAHLRGIDGWILNPKVNCCKS